MKKLKKIFSKIINRETILYLIFGILTTIVSIGTYIAALYIMAGERIPTELEINTANVISWILAVSFAYITNKIWVFESHAKNTNDLLREIISFFAARLFSLGFEIVWLNMLLFLFGPQYNAIYKITAQFGIVAMNYILSKLFIFKGK